MQLTQSPDPKIATRIQEALQEQRIRRYMPAAGQDINVALEFYIWNCDICEAFYLPLHIAEVLTRNAIHRCLVARLGENWHENQVLKRVLIPMMRDNLNDAVDYERGQHGAGMTHHHVVSALRFAFWEHLLTKRFERLLWHRGMQHSFPGAGNNRREDIRNRVEAIRQWRNRIAHHQAVFDKGPTRKYQETMELIGWVCPDTAGWIHSVSRVPAIIGLRPGSKAAPRLGHTRI